MAIPYIEKTIKSHLDFESTIHSVYDQEDIFPKLLRNSYDTTDKAAPATNENNPPIPKQLQSPQESSQV